jgi:subtilase family serine protease
MQLGHRRSTPGQVVSLAAVLTVTLGAFVAAVAPASAAASGAAAFHRVGSAPAIPEGAALIGRTPASQAIHFDLVLTPRDPAGLHALALAVSTPGSPDRGRFLSVPQFAARFGQTRSAIHSADSALRHLGLRPGPATANGLVVPVVTTAGQAARSLHTEFTDYRLSSGRLAFANTAAPRLPASLAHLTTAVIGLNDLATSAISPLAKAAGSRNLTRSAGLKKKRPIGPTACKAASKQAKKDNGWTYRQLAAAYSINSLYKQHHFGSGVRIALFELDAWSSSDVANFQKCYKTKARVTSVKVDGGDGGGAGGGEAALDIDTAIALAPQAAITVYDAPAANYALSMVDELSKIFDDDSAQVLSMSYGLCESVVEGIDSGLAESENLLFEQAAAEGISVFVASGDTGSEGCYRATHSTALAVLDPASQPFVTAVGGTDVQAVGPPPKERVWNESKLQAGAGGGGISSDWTMPAWQSGPGVINSYSSGTPCDASSGDCREVPDVSASADPEHGYIIRWKGKWVAIGGTSAATPLWAAMVADIVSAHSPVYRAGFLNPLLYAAAATAKSPFHDITVGNNDYTKSHDGAYPATTAYDMASGLGSPKATAIETDIDANNSLIAFTGAPGTDPPPGHLGKYKVTAFDAACTPGTYYASISAPTGTVALSPQSECEEVGVGWATWSNGYDGDVYWQNADEGGSTTLTLTLPAGTRAFYFYAEPNEFETFDLQATAQNGTTSGPLQVYGDAGAQYYGFYANGKGENIATITISCDDDFAIGEFGIAG